MSVFEDLIASLGHAFSIRLQAEDGVRCKIRLGNLSVQIEYIEAKGSIIFLSFIAEVPAGRFREEVFVAALKANAQQNAFGTFAYSNVADKLALQLFLPVSTSSEQVKAQLDIFLEKATSWKTAIESGNIQLVSKGAMPSGPSPIQLMR